MKQSLCWSCQRAVLVYGKSCSWAMDYKPVKGWKATRTIQKQQSTLIKSGYRLTESYQVEDCPLYLSDEDVKRKYGTPDPTWNGIE